MRCVRKHYYTDAAEDSFRFYFANPTFVEDLLHKPVNYGGIAFRGASVSDPTATEVIYREYARGKNTWKVRQWDAADKTISALRQERDGIYKVAILKSAYGASCDCGVGNRVRCKAREVSASEKQAWDWINKAFLYWAIFRGLI